MENDRVIPVVLCCFMSNDTNPLANIWLGSYNWNYLDTVEVFPMSVANRLKRLLDVNGHSYAKAEEVTGVSRETIRRIANGEEPPKLASYLSKIAAGYNVDKAALLEGATPKGEFEWNIRQAPAAQRLEWLLMPPAGRVKLTLDFLRVRYPDAVNPKALAAAAGMSESNLRNMLERWEVTPPDRQVASDIANTLSALTGISQAWFQWGGLSDAWTEGAERLTKVSRWARTPGLSKALKDLVTAG